MSYEVSFVRIWGKIDRFITSPQCICHAPVIGCLTNYRIEQKLCFLIQPLGHESRCPRSWIEMCRAMFLNQLNQMKADVEHSDIRVCHDEVIKWKQLPRYWTFLRGIHRSPVNSPHKGQWRGALMFSLICAWINGWINNGEAGDLRRHRSHYNVTVMLKKIYLCLSKPSEGALQHEKFDH